MIVLKTKKLKTKKKIELEFYEKKWFKLVCLFAFFGWLFYLGWGTFQINKNKLIEIKVTVSEKWKSGGSKNPNCILKIFILLIFISP